jgi:hypothetical protein
VSVGLAVLLALGTLTLGDVLLRSLRLEFHNGFERAGFAAAAGLAVALFALYAPFALTGRVHFVPLALLQSAACLVSLPALVQALRRPRSLRARLALAIYLVGLLGVLFVATRAPFSAYDDRAIYGIKGKALWLERDASGPIFSDLEVVHYHRDYPLGLPLLIAYSAWVGDPHPEDPKGSLAAADGAQWVARYDAILTYAPWSVLWPAALAALAVAFALRSAKGAVRRVALLPLALPVAVVFPWLVGDGWSLSGADLPMALLNGAAGLAVVAWWNTRTERWLVLAGVLMAAAFLIKQDAVLSAVGALGALALARGRRPRASSFALAALAAAAAVACVTIVGRGVPTPPFEEDYARAVREGSPALWLQRIPLILTSSWLALEEAHMTVFWLAALAVALPAGWRRGGHARFLAAWIALHIALILGVFLVTPDQVAWHVLTALTRILCHMALPAGMLLMEFVAPAFDAFRAALNANPATARTDQ